MAYKTANKIPPLLIGVSGKKNSGKNTVASMLQFFLTHKIAYADYYDWEKYDKFDKKRHVNEFSFADYLKDFCSNIFDIDRSNFDNRDKKDVFYYSFAAKKFYTESDVKIKQLIYLNCKNLVAGGFNQLKNYKCCTKLRDILQFVGTEIVKFNIYDRAWITALDVRVKKHFNNNRFAIITDVRFEDEKEYVLRHTSSTGLLFHVVRDKENFSSDEHISEKLNVEEADNIIIVDNTEGLYTLFYKLRGIISDKLKNYTK